MSTKKNYNPKVVYICQAPNAVDGDRIEFQRSESDEDTVEILVADRGQKTLVHLNIEDLRAVAEKL